MVSYRPVALVGMRKRVKRTKPDDTHGGIDEPIAGPRGQISGPLKDGARVKRYKVRKN